MQGYHPSRNYDPRRSYQTPNNYPKYFQGNSYQYTPQYQPMRSENSYPAYGYYYNSYPQQPQRQSTLHYTPQTQFQGMYNQTQPDPEPIFKRIEVRTAEAEHLLKALKNKMLGRFTGPMKGRGGKIPVRVVSQKNLPAKEPLSQNLNFNQAVQARVTATPVQGNNQNDKAIPDSQISWFTGSPHELVRPNFKPLFSSAETSPEKHPKASLLSMKELERSKKKVRRAESLLNSKIYEKPKKSLKEKLGDSWDWFKYDLPDRLRGFVRNPFWKMQVSKLSLVMFVLSSGFLAAMFLISPQRQGPGEVAGAQESGLQDSEQVAYENWIKEANEGTFSQPEVDLDSDQLTNYEEFIIGTDPLLANTCNPEVTDIENILNVINPVTCEPINMEDEDEVKFFSEIINLPDVQKEILNEVAPEEATTEIPASIKETFGVADFVELDGVSQDSLKAQVQTTEEKKAILATVRKIDEYVTENRSYEVYDRDYEAPVHPAVYLDVARRYNVPLKYVLAIARLESRFGTDRYTNSGNLTRPGQFQNIYSIGLTDGGQNLKYESWEQGVEGFGKWYTKFHERGVSDCAKWRIYNPNGDYCSKVEKLASEIEEYLNS
jgi:hypothetical protein